MTPTPLSDDAKKVESAELEMIVNAVHRGGFNLTKLPSLTFQELQECPTYAGRFRGLYPVGRYVDPLLDAQTRSNKVVGDWDEDWTYKHKPDYFLSKNTYKIDTLYPRGIEQRNDYWRERAHGDRGGMATLLAHGVQGFTGWHQDVNPTCAVVSQLQQGKKLWFVVPRLPARDCSWLVRSGHPTGLPSSRPSRLYEDLTTYSNRISYCWQEPRDVVWIPFGFGHCVLTLETSVLMTWTVGPETDEELDHQNQLIQNRNAIRVRKPLENAGCSKGKRKKLNWRNHQKTSQQ